MNRRPARGVLVLRAGSPLAAAPRERAVRGADVTARVVLGSDGVPDALRAEAARQWSHRAVAVVPTLGLAPETLLVAVKPPEDASPGAVARRFGAAVRALVKERAARARIVAPADLPDTAAGAVALGLARALYRFDRYAAPPEAALPRLELELPRPAWRAPAERALVIGQAATLARDLVNTPAEDMGPDELERVARQLGRRTGLSVRVLDAARCRRLGLGGLTAVGRASPRAPRLIVLEHRGAPRSTEVLALAGKGIVFDTGGLNLKTAAGMELMKKDMGGAATVLGAAWAVGRLKPRRNVRFYLAIAENAVGGNAMRPGDVLRLFDGTTVEVGNTDAEGRLVLGDAIAFAVHEGATRIVDAATLTGAALVALGRLRVPLIGNDEALLGAVEAAAGRAGERVWRLPADPEYKDLFRSKIATLRNTGKGGEAGAIVAGLFLGHFAGKVPWAHLDISPASWSDAAHDLGPEGATGVMVATLAELALS